MRAAVCLWWLGACGEGPPGPAAAPATTGAAPVACEAPLVLAAADLAPALTELAAQYAATYGCAPTLSFGSTGAFTTQLEQGARADVFFAASVDFIDRLDRAGLVRAGTRVEYALGRLVLVAPPGRAPPASLAGLSDPAFRFVAIANPEHAPYGRAAEQALASSGQLETVRPRLVLGENIAQAVQLVDSGNADAGIVALSLALAREGAAYTPIDASLHDPLVQVAAIPTAAERPEAGRKMIGLVTGALGRPVMERYGFVRPSE